MTQDIQSSMMSETIYSPFNPKYSPRSSPKKNEKKRNSAMSVIKTLWKLGAEIEKI